ncbi:fibrillin-1-like, partial [Strongylocentrotus purpuratus]|uniref:EGF-like domain-containing protein n=1 Tax=Strongylocentrotus purpuratus TaxID=7668 RepID=A0A7M7NY31_STRPU
VVLCECEPGWSGEFCEVDYDACEDGPCFMGVACFDEAPPSLNNTCGPCPEGLEGDGRFCQAPLMAKTNLLVDHFNCDMPMGNPHTSRDVPPMQILTSCELYQDEPASSGGRGCDQICNNTLMDLQLQFVNAVCNNTQGSYECDCKPGFRDDFMDGTSCTDLVECTDNSSYTCDEKAKCENTIGSYLCVCIAGYEGDGKTCQDLNECTTVRTIVWPLLVSAATQWVALTAAVRMDIPGTVGQPVQEAMFKSLGPYRTIGGSLHYSNAHGGSFVIEAVRADPGYVLVTPSPHFATFLDALPNPCSANNIDECTLELDNCQQECFNKEGSFDCNCSAGFTLQDGVCQAVMCVFGYNLPHKGECYKTNNADMCLCKPGYAIDDDPTVCEDIDECTSPSDPDMCGANSMCDNLEGSYECRCHPGYTLNSDQRTCS